MNNIMYIMILKTNIIKMKTLILGTLLILTVVFFGCENNPVNELQGDKLTNTKTAIITTYDLGTETFIADEIRYTNFQGQGFYIMLNGEILKQATNENTKSLTFK